VFDTETVMLGDSEKAVDRVGKTDCVELVVTLSEDVEE
jgi:hypothetical protein